MPAIPIQLTEQEICDIKYAVELMYRYSQSKNHIEGIKHWGILAEKLSTIKTNISGYNDEDYMKRHLDGEFKKES